MKYFKIKRLPYRFLPSAGIPEWAIVIFFPLTRDANIPIMQKTVNRIKA